jgi:hypothetical protein
MNYSNQIYTDKNGKAYLTLYLAWWGDDASYARKEPVVVYYAAEDKSKVLIMNQTDFANKFSHHNPYGEAFAEIEQEDKLE